MASPRPLPVPRGWPTARLFQRPVAAGPEVEECARVEAASYPADEAASPEQLESRQREAGAYFLGTFDEAGVLVGFVCGTRAAGPALTDESMERHVPNGPLLCVHSVVTRPEMRKRGVASVMLRGYLQAVAADTNGASAPPSACALIAKAHLVGLYQKSEFQLVGLSPVVHGADPWFELRIDNIARAAVAEPVVRFDAFASSPCDGNSGAVAFTQRDGDERWMQRVALENNLAETAFVERLPAPDEQSGKDGPSRFALRWFTPACEVDLCGHATLGAAHGLWETGRADKSRPIAFESKASGVLTCKLSDGWIEMDFPSDPPLMGGEASPQPPSKAEMAQALGAPEAAVLSVGRGRFDLICELTPEAFDTMSPDQTALAKFETRGIVATTMGSDGSCDAERAAVASEGAAIDFRSRFFGPRVGVPEDPVTGSAHCMLAPYWARRLERGGEAVVVGFQASARGGAVRCRLFGSEGNGRVAISGRAVTSLEGLLHCG